MFLAILMVFSEEKISSEHYYFIVSVCGNTMCYLNYREAEVQVLKRT